MRRVAPDLAIERVGERCLEGQLDDHERETDEKDERHQCDPASAPISSVETL
jgi:hypothetical protein